MTLGTFDAPQAANDRWCAVEVKDLAAALKEIDAGLVFVVVILLAATLKVRSRPHSAFGVWRLAFGIRLLAFGFWLLAFGVWLLAFGFWR